MESLEYRVRLQGLSTPEGTIPLKALLDVSEALLEGSRRALRLVVEGVSVKRGQISKALQKPLDFTMTGISRGSTILQIEAPIFKDSAPELVKQLSLWDSPMKPEDTAISLLSKSVHDATGGNVESDYYDRGVLESLMSFKQLLNGPVSSVEVVCSNQPADGFKINRRGLAKIRKIEADIPTPQAIVVAGTFNSIEHASRRFELVLRDGLKIRGIANPSFIDAEQMRALWGQKVTVKGIGHFKPGGTVRSIEAEVAKPFDEGEELFETMPKSRLPASLIRDSANRQSIKSPLQEVWGKWPGDESIEEILESLRQIS